MLFHSRFVLSNLFGRTVTWRSQERADRETSWGEAIRRHGIGTLFASAWGIGVFSLNPDFFWWLTPIVGALVLSVPVSVLASRVGLGQRARAAGLFLIPEEHDPPQELRDLEAPCAVPAGGFARAVVDPAVNALHAVLQGEPRSLRPSIRETRRALLARALAEGPGALSAEQRVVLADHALLVDLHQGVWSLTNRRQARRWEAGRS
jgi:membrane glycosyltransferase